MSASSSTDTCSAREDFFRILGEFVSDLKGTFPEYTVALNAIPASNKTFRHCKKKFMPLFFDIMYEHAELFTDPEKDTELLPGIRFATLWTAEGVSENIHKTLWKYLQLLSFSIMGQIEDSSELGDETNQLFQAINSKEFQGKLEEVFANMQSTFDASASPLYGACGAEQASGMNNHIQQLLGGKLGKLATEIAEEVADEWGDITGDESGEQPTVSSVFQTLFRNPSKLKSIMSRAQAKMEEKIKSGEIKESEIYAEATEMMDTMGLGKMFQAMGMGGGRGGRMNEKAMKAAMERKMRQAKQREKMQAKVRARQAASAAVPSASSSASSSAAPSGALSDADLVKLFSSSAGTGHGKKKK